MKVELAENQKEITLGQYQDFIKLSEREDLTGIEFNKRKVKIFTGLSYKDISAMDYTDLEYFINGIDKALNTEAKFEPRFEMNGVEFGFVPNFDDIKAKEYFDLTSSNPDTETLHKLMAVLFRPIKHEVGKEYEIVNYQGTSEWSDVMKRMPLNIVNGSLVFFLNLVRDLESYTLRFTAQEAAKAKQASTLKSGGGMRRLMNWLKGSRGNISSLKI